MDNLESIAQNYHLQGGMPDMFIEAICQEYEIKWLSKHITESSRVLDLGLGDGLFLEAFKNHKDFTILEGSESLARHGVETVRQLGSEVKIIHTYFENYLPSDRFDIIIASHVLEHVTDPDHIIKLCGQWLKPHGKLIVIVPNKESLHRRLGVEMGLQKELDDLSPRDHAVGHLRVYDLKTLLSELRSNNFEILENRGFFTKALSNGQMIHLDPEVIKGLCELSSTLPAEMGANIGVVATNE